MASKRIACGTAITPAPVITRCSCSISSVIWNAARCVPAMSTAPTDCASQCDLRILRHGHCKPIGWFRDHSKLSCEGCGYEIALHNEELRAEINELHSVMSGLRRQAGQ